MAGPSLQELCTARPWKPSAGNGKPWERRSAPPKLPSTRLTEDFHLLAAPKPFMRDEIVCKPAETSAADIPRSDETNQRHRSRAIVIGSGNTATVQSRSRPESLVSAGQRSSTRTTTRVNDGIRRCRCYSMAFTFFCRRRGMTYMIGRVCCMAAFCLGPHPCSCCQKRMMDRVCYVDTSVRPYHGATGFRVHDAVRSFPVFPEPAVSALSAPLSHPLAVDNALARELLDSFARPSGGGHRLSNRRNSA